jgi:alpha-maltose-1-phosphate synthase
MVLDDKRPRRKNPGKARMSVAIATSGRFHVLDLARELDSLGADVRFYSYVTRRRAKEFGLPGRCHVALLPMLFPFVALERLLPKLLPNLTERLLCWALDLAVIVRMRRCDVFICMSGMYLLAARFAKWRYGALIHLHRSSRHILSQRDILAKFNESKQVSSYIARRELLGYALADHIIVPSGHVVESFSPWPEISSKLFLNPLGVDIDLFPFRNAPTPEQPPTILFVGQWCYRKGVDTLVEAVNEMPEVRLIHVGAFADAPFPSDPRFIHWDHVPQGRLPEFYASAHVLVLPSREDGFGVVLSQALSSGLPVVCTDKTGGPDLVRLAGLSRLVWVVPPDDPSALSRAIARAISAVTGSVELSPITQSERQMLGWRGYAERDLQFMRRMVDRKQAAAGRSPQLVRSI